MATLNIYVVPNETLLTKNVNLDVDSPDSIINQLENSGEIPPSPPDGGGNVTIWKMTKSGRGNRNLRFYPGGITDGDTVLLVPVPTNI